MKFPHRAVVMGVLIALAILIFGTAKHYSPALVIYVTEQTLMQKAPTGTDLEFLLRRFQSYMNSFPDSDSRLAAAMAISQYLEKIQHLTPQELDRLLTLH
jgi:hypothetical protein